jgi:hypothetical protein
MKKLSDEEYRRLDQQIVEVHETLLRAKELLQKALTKNGRLVPVKIHKDRATTGRGYISKAVLDVESLRNDIARWQGVREPGAMRTC